MLKRIFLLLVALFFIIPICNALIFEKDYFVILTDVELNESKGYGKIDGFNAIETVIFNNGLCDKYLLTPSYTGNLWVKLPVQIFETKTGVNTESTEEVLYTGVFNRYLYKCGEINIFNFNFKADPVFEVHHARYPAYKPEYIYFGETPLNIFINITLNEYLNKSRDIGLDRNSQLFEMIKVNESGFQFSDKFCNEVGYFIINDFHPAIFSESHKSELCNLAAYSLLKNHFLYLNEIQGFFISDYNYVENYNFEDAFEAILVRKLAEKAIYRKYYETYQTKNIILSFILTIMRPFDKAYLYDIQSKNVNIQVPELIDLLNNIDKQLRVSEFSELAITRINMKNEILGWFSIILGLIGFIIGLKVNRNRTS